MYKFIGGYMFLTNLDKENKTYYNYQDQKKCIQNSHTSKTETTHKSAALNKEQQTFSLPSKIKSPDQITFTHA